MLSTTWFLIIFVVFRNYRVWTSNAIKEPFCHRQPWRAALAPQPSVCVEQSSSQIDEATISSVFFSLKLSFSLSLTILFCLELSPFLLQRFFPLHSRIQRRYVYSCDGTHSTRWARVRESRAKKMNSVFNARWLDSPRGCICFLGVDLKEKKYFRSLSLNF